MKLPWRILLLVPLAATAGGAGLVWYAARVVSEEARERVFDDLTRLPHRRVTLVLGCAPRLGGGTPNPYFVNRIRAAAAVFDAGKTDYLLVSGDNHTVEYDEPTAMKKALVQLGIPEERIIADYAGFSTSDSVLRAKLVFGLTDLCVVSQRDHAMRAIYIAHHHDIDAIGFEAKDIPRKYGWRIAAREALARVRTIFDVNVFGRQPRFTGPRTPIGEKGD